jgi:hypothetical protein
MMLITMRGAAREDLREAFDFLCWLLFTVAAGLAVAVCSCHCLLLVLLVGVLIVGSDKSNEEKMGRRRDILRPPGRCVYISINKHRLLCSVCRKLVLETGARICLHEPINTTTTNVMGC